jgi:hypothetical protein
MSVTAMRREMTAPGGDVLFFDSAEPDKSDPQLREQMAKFINQPLAVLRIDPRGKVVEVKESKFGPASKYESDLPFSITLPDGEPKAGQAWERAYKLTLDPPQGTGEKFDDKLTLDPPQGTGEKFDAVQKCVCKAINGSLATVGVAATIQALPAAAGDQVPLLGSQPEGEVVVDLQAGLLKSVNLHVDKELKNHQGDGTSFHLQSTYLEQYAGDK